MSECLHHDTTAVHLYQTLNSFFTEISSSQITATKDCPSFPMVLLLNTKTEQNFINLCHHKEDFGISAEWHFSATAHGQGICDGLGGTVKRLAARASLQKSYNDQIMTPRQLYDWATVNIPTIHFNYCSSDGYEAEKQDLEQQFLRSRTIPGTCKLHSFIPISKHANSTHLSLFQRISSMQNSFQQQPLARKKESLFPKTTYLQNQLQDLLHA